MRRSVHGSERMQTARGLAATDQSQTTNPTAMQMAGSVWSEKTHLLDLSSFYCFPRRAGDLPV